jgi:hypothetical protein
MLTWCVDRTKTVADGLLEIVTLKEADTLVCGISGYRWEQRPALAGHHSKLSSTCAKLGCQHSIAVCLPGLVRWPVCSWCWLSQYADWVLWTGVPVGLCVCCSQKKLGSVSDDLTHKATCNTIVIKVGPGLLACRKLTQACGCSTAGSP